MSNGETSLQRLTEDQRAEHAFLQPDDEIYFLCDYHPGRDGGVGNRLILDFKTDINEARLTYWVGRQKSRATRTLAEEVRHVWPSAWGEDTRAVPVPPSGPWDHPDYDPRLTDLLKIAGISFSDIMVLTDFFKPIHLETARPSPADLAATYRVARRALPQRRPARWVIFDDVLTTGRHFRAMDQVLRAAFPKAQIAGLFLARRVEAPPTLGLGRGPARASPVE